MAEIGQTDFSFKPNVDMTGIASLFQRKAEAEQNMKLQAEQQKSSEQSRALQTMQMASQLTQNLIQYSATKQTQTAQKQLASLMASGSNMVPSDQMTPAKSSLFPQMSQAAESVPYSQTPEYKATQRSLAVQAFPKEAADEMAKAAFKEQTAGASSAAKMFINPTTGDAKMIAPDEQGSFTIPAGFQESSIAKATVWAKPREEANQIRKDQFLEGQWNKLGKAVNSLDKGSRTSVGMAAVGNQRVARAIVLVDDPKMDTVLKKYIEADLAGVMQGGAPHEQMLRQQGYENLATKWAQLKQQVTSKPQALQIPEVRAQLKETLLGIMAVDNEILDINVGAAKETFLQAVQSDPERFSRLTGVMERVKTVGTKPESKLDFTKTSTADLFKRLAGGR